MIQTAGISNADQQQIRLAYSLLGSRLVAVQNQFSPGFRSSEDELQLCAELGLAFLPWSPLGGIGRASALADRGIFQQIANEHGVSPQQVCLAWELSLSPTVSDGEFSAALGQLDSEPGHHSDMILEAASDRIEGALSVEAASLRLPRRVEFVQMPPEPADQPGSLRYKGFPVVYQKPDLTVRAVETGQREVRLTLRGAGHGQCVDRIGLAVGAGGVADVGHQLRRHPHDRLTGRQ